MKRKKKKYEIDRNRSFVNEVWLHRLLIRLHWDYIIEQLWLDYEYNVSENLRLRLYYDYSINKIYVYDYDYSIFIMYYKKNKSIVYKLCECHIRIFHWWIKHIINQILNIISNTFAPLFLIWASKAVEVNICFFFSFTHDISQTNEHFMKLYIYLQHIHWYTLNFCLCRSTGSSFFMFYKNFWNKHI